jgi:hypothetical protein
MKCPSCGASWHRVVETRQTDQWSISRRRKCNACDHLFFTAEVAVHPDNAGYRANRGKGGTRRNYDFGVNADLLRLLALMGSRPIEKAS